MAQFLRVPHVRAALLTTFVLTAWVVPLVATLTLAETVPAFASMSPASLLASAGVASAATAFAGVWWFAQRTGEPAAILNGLLVPVMVGLILGLWALFGTCVGAALGYAVGSTSHARRRHGRRKGTAA